MAKRMNGVVTSDAQDKTIVITITRRETHPLYGKQYTVSKKVAAHDEKNEAHVGDKVVIVETRPISKHKTWKLGKVLEAGHAAVEIKDEAEELAKAEEKAS